MRPLVPLAALVAVLAAAPPARAQAVRDSLPITIRPTYDETITEYRDRHNQPYYVGTCVINFVGVFPDVLGRKGLPRSYSVVAAGPPAYFRLSGLVSQSNIDLYFRRYVPEGHLAFGSNVGSSASWAVSDPYPNYADCSRLRAYYAGEIGKMPPYYAVYTLPNGTPVALFDYDADDGLRVTFDGSFESKQSHEVDASAPGGKRPVVSYRWDFGEPSSPSNIGTGARPTHVYADTGRYTVTLTVTDDDGQTDPYTREVKVEKAGLLVWAERTLSAPSEYGKGDTVSVTTWVENRSDEIAVNVKVPRTNGFVSTFPASVTTGNKSSPAYKRVSDLNETVATIPDVPPGERRSVTTRYLVESYAQYRGPLYYQTTSVETFPTIHGVTGEQGYVGGPPARVTDKCGPDEACGETWNVAPPVVRVAFEMRTAAGTGGTVRSGLVARADAAEPSFYSGPATTASFDDVTCASGCVELIATAYDRNDAPVEGADVRFTIEALAGEGVLTTYPRGGHVCSKLRSGQTAANPTCGARTITVKTAADGQARAIYAVQAVSAPTSGPVEAAAVSDGVVMDYRTQTLTVEPNEAFAREATLTGYDAKFLLVNRMLVNRGGEANSIGDYCENSVKWLRDQGGVQDFDAAFKTGAVFLTNVGTSWVCGEFANKAASIAVRGRQMLDWLLGENKVGAGADLMKKYGALHLYLWTLGAYEVKNPHGLSLVSGPHPAPLVVQPDGDFYEWTATALGALIGPISGGLTSPVVARDLTGVRTRLRIFEASTMKMGASGGALTANYLRAHVGLDEWAGGDWTNVSSTGAEYLYQPALFLGRSRSEWLADLIARIPNPLAAGDASADAGPSGGQPPAEGGAERAGPLAKNGVTWKAGDVVTIGDGATTELNQIATVEPLAAGTRVTFVRPLARAHPAGATLGFLAAGEAGAPPAPLLVPNSDPNARTELGWTPNSATLAAAYDVRIARDSAMTQVVHAETDTRGTSAALDVNALAQGQPYYWQVRAKNRLGDGPWSPVYAFVARAVAVGMESEAAPVGPAAVTLHAPYPNPSRTTATIRYDVPAAGPVRLAVYDALGREVAVLADGARAAGRHEATAPVGAWSPGLYLVRLDAGGHRQVRPLAVVR